MRDDHTIQVFASTSLYSNLGHFTLGDVSSNCMTTSGSTSSPPREMNSQAESLTSFANTDGVRIQGVGALGGKGRENQPRREKVVPSTTMQVLRMEAKTPIKNNMGSLGVNTTSNALVVKSKTAGLKTLKTSALATAAEPISRVRSHHIWQHGSCADDNSDCGSGGRTPASVSYTASLTVPHATFDDEVFINDLVKLQSHGNLLVWSRAKEEASPRPKPRRKRRKLKQTYKIDLVTAARQSREIFNDEEFVTSLVLKKRKFSKRRRRKKHPDGSSVDVKVTDKKNRATKASARSKSDTAVGGTGFRDEATAKKRHRSKSPRKRAASVISMPVSQEKKDSQKRTRQEFLEAAKAALEGRIRERMAEKGGEACNVVSSESGIERIAALFEFREKKLRLKSRKHVKRYRGVKGSSDSKNVDSKNVDSKNRSTHRENHKETDVSPLHSKIRLGRTDNSYNPPDRMKVRIDQLSTSEPDVSKLALNKRGHLLDASSGSTPSLVPSLKGAAKPGVNRAQNNRSATEMFWARRAKLPPGEGKKESSESPSQSSSRLKDKLNVTFATEDERVAGVEGRLQNRDGREPFLIEGKECIRCKPPIYRDTSSVSFLRSQPSSSSAFTPTTIKGQTMSSPALTSANTQGHASSSPAFIAAKKKEQTSSMPALTSTSSNPPFNSAYIKGEPSSITRAPASQATTLTSNNRGQTSLSPVLTPTNIQRQPTTVFALNLPNTKDQAISSTALTSPNTRARTSSSPELTSSKTREQKSPPRALTPSNTIMQISPSPALTSPKTRVQKSPSPALTSPKTKVQKSASPALTSPKTRVQKSASPALTSPKTRVQKSPSPALTSPKTSVQKSPSPVLTSPKTSVQKRPSAALTSPKTRVKISPSRALSSSKTRVQKSPSLARTSAKRTATPTTPPSGIKSPTYRRRRLVPTMSRSTSNAFVSSPRKRSRKRKKSVNANAKKKSQSDVVPSMSTSANHTDTQVLEAAHTEKKRKRRHISKKPKVSNLNYSNTNPQRDTATRENNSGQRAISTKEISLGTNKNSNSYQILTSTATDSSSTSECETAKSSSGRSIGGNKSPNEG
ncbi:hypothetical protein EGW08_001684, partial [Elysia chlorotica]